MRRLFFVALLAVAIFVFWWNRTVPAQVEGLTQITVDQLSPRLQAAPGTPELIVFYSTADPRTRAVFTSLSDLARRYKARGVSLKAYSVDLPQDVSEIPDFLKDHEAPFDPVYLKPWPKGRLIAALGPAGIRIGSSWMIPLIAVRSRTGTIVAAGEGVVDVTPFETALQAEF